MMTRQSLSIAGMACIAILSGCHAPVEPADGESSQGPGPEFHGVIGKDVRDSTPSFVVSPRAGSGAPNVVVILLDDLGYADLGSYGSEIDTPHIDGLAANGVRYNRFTATAICSPSRAALLTGLNHHSAGLGWLASADWGYPGYRGVLSRNALTLAEILQAQGYATLMVGKWHLARSADETRAGPFDAWPTHRGFQRYWGFLAGETSQWFPNQIVDGTTVVDVPTDGSFYLPDALTDKAIEMIRDKNIARPEQPFFLYYATGAPHAPHHVKPADLAKYQGRYDAGWDVIRDQRLARQKRSGLIPEDTALTPYGPEVPQTWDELNADQRRMYARFQENYAAFVDNIDQNIGRLLAYLRQIGELDNTLFVLTSDNGASREVSTEGGTNVWGHFYHFQPSTTDENLDDYDVIGSWKTHPHYPRGWMQASNTPFINGKRTTFGGGVNVPLIISWVNGIGARGEIRSQFHHMTDVAPTILELLQVEHPRSYPGRRVKPMEGISMAYSLEDGGAPSRRSEQYYEIEGHRAYVADDWKIVTWRPDGKHYDEVPWELYNLAEDFSEAHDLAARYPEKVVELEAKWWAAARRYDVLPVNDQPLLNRAPWVPASDTANQTRFEFFPSDPTIPAAFQPSLLRRSYEITIDLERAGTDEHGVLVASGDRYSGWALYIADNRLIYENNLPRVGRKIVSRGGVPIGAIEVKFAFERSGDPASLAGVGRLYIDGELVGEGELPLPVFRAWEGLDVGRDSLTPISRSYDAPNRFTGRISKALFELSPREGT